MKHGASDYVIHNVDHLPLGRLTDGYGCEDSDLSEILGSWTRFQIARGVVDEDVCTRLLAHTELLLV